jgi:hypothetical protein
MNQTFIFFYRSCLRSNTLWRDVEMELRKTIGMGIALFVMAVGFSSTARGTILPFDTTGGPLSSTYLWSTANGSLYGDNVSAASQNGFVYGDTVANPTPNVVLTYEQSGNGSSLWLDSGVLTDGTVVSALILTGDAGYTVTLHSFDVVALTAAPTNYSYIKVFLDGSATPSYTLPNYFINGSNTLNEGDEWTAGLLAGNVVRIEWLFAGSFGQAFNHGLDNINFTQAVPEPASLGLLAVSGLVLATRRRTRAVA